MTTSMAAGWVFVIGGFTGLVAMQLVIVLGSRPPRKARPQRTRRVARDEAAPTA